LHAHLLEVVKTGGCTAAGRRGGQHAWNDRKRELTCLERQKKIINMPGTTGKDN
jgi:hypothetical protein